MLTARVIIISTRGNTLTKVLAGYEKNDTKEREANNMEVNNKIVEINAGKKRALERLYKLSYWFSNEMLNYIAEEEQFSRKCKEAEEKGESVIMVSAATNNKKCMQHCLQATNEAINYIRKKDNEQFLELWQLDGINAMFDRCKKENEIPFDLPCNRV